MTAKTFSLRLQITFKSNSRESPLSFLNKKRILMLTKLKASQEDNLLFVTSVLIMNKLKVNKSKTNKVLSRTWKSMPDNKFKNKHQKKIDINITQTVNATSSLKWPSRWRMASMSIQWCLMVCQTSTNAHHTSFKWCTSTISRWWSTIKWTRWTKAWSQWASPLPSSLH